jgi:hypothetical protein
MGDSKLGTDDRYTRVAPLGPGMRVLFAIIGCAALVPVVLIGANEFRAMSGTSFVGPVLMLAFCGVVLVGALLLLQAALRGTTPVRRPSGRRPHPPHRSS